MSSLGVESKQVVPAYIQNNLLRAGGDDGGLRKRLTFPFRGTELVVAIERTLRDIEEYYQKLTASQPQLLPSGCGSPYELVNNATVFSELLTYLALFRREPERTFFLSMSDVYYFGLHGQLQESPECRQDD